jgi:rod shape-determining protein MreD
MPMTGQLNPRSRVDPFGRKINRAHSPILAHVMPWATILFGSFVPLLPVIAPGPILPPFGFLILIAWRQIRPGLLPLWAGFPLGLFDDLFSGQPFGSAILLFSLAMLGLELLEARFPWRGFWQDWVTAAVVIAAYLFSAAVLSGLEPELRLFLLILPQVALSILLFPIVGRLIAWLDALRLTRIRSLG